jgi:hypothetical protein
VSLRRFSRDSQNHAEQACAAKDLLALHPAIVTGRLA